MENTSFEETVKQSLVGSAFFKGLDEAALMQLAGGMRPVSLKHHEILFLQDDKPDGCYVLLEGTLKVSIINEEGEETILAALGNSDLFGEMGLLDDAPRSATITALKRSRLAFLSTGRFGEIAGRHPDIYRHLLRLLCTRLRITNDSFQVRQSMALDGRLAHMLLRLADGFGNQLDGERVMIFHKFTQSDLGDMVGAARENVSRQLNQWCREGVLSKISGYYCIEEPQVLRDLETPGKS
jgi:CRP-like cAMP-binding protein